jgi:hypothetical protein
VGDQRVALEVGKAFGHAMPGEIVRRGAQDAVIGRKPLGDEAGIPQVCDAHREIEAFSDDIDEGVGQDQLDADHRVGVEERLEMRRDVQPPERGRRRDPQRAARLAGAAGHPGFGFLDRAEDRHHAFVEALACLGQRELARGALEQAHAQPVLQPPDALGDDGRRQVELAAGGRHAFGGDDAGEDVEVAEPVHARSIFSILEIIMDGARAASPVELF